MRSSIWFLPLGIFYISTILANPFRQSNSGVKLFGREKIHEDGEKCPTNLTHCKCKLKKSKIDITCEEITSAQLKVCNLKLV